MGRTPSPRACSSSSRRGHARGAEPAAQSGLFGFTAGGARPPSRYLEGKVLPRCGVHFTPSHANTRPLHTSTPPPQTPRGNTTLSAPATTSASPKRRYPGSRSCTLATVTKHPAPAPWLPGSHSSPAHLVSRSPDHLRPRRDAGGRTLLGGRRIPHVIYSVCPRASPERRAETETREPTTDRGSRSDTPRRATCLALARLSRPLAPQAPHSPARGDPRPPGAMAKPPWQSSRTSPGSCPQPPLGAGGRHARINSGFPVAVKPSLCPSWCIHNRVQVTSGFFFFFKEVESGKHGVDPRHPGQPHTHAHRESREPPGRARVCSPFKGTEVCPWGAPAALPDSAALGAPVSPFRTLPRAPAVPLGDAPTHTHTH